MNVEYFVWYGISGDPLATRVAIDGMMTDVARRTGVSGRLLVRHNKSDTWMEIYERVADPVAFEREITSAALRHDLARFITGGARHVEAFVAAD
jgi:Domain of unknown function (DUF4936)